MLLKLYRWYNNLSVKNRTAILLFFATFLVMGIVTIFSRIGTNQHVVISTIFVMGVFIIGTIEWLRSYNLGSLTIFIIATSLSICALIPFDFITQLYFTSTSEPALKSFVDISFNYYHLIVLAVALLFVLFDRGFIYSRNRFKKLVLLIIGLPIILLAIKFAIIILTISSLDLFFFIGIGIFTDTFASIGGKLLGKYIPYKLAPGISPNKTIIGFIIGYMAGFAWVIAGSFMVRGGLFFYFVPNRWTYIMVFASVAPIVSVVGDLFFSYIKRLVSLKDFSALLPGHGGVFDRIDSHIFVLAFSFLWYWYSSFIPPIQTLSLNLPPSQALFGGFEVLTNILIL